MGHKHSVYDTDTHFLIDGLTRAVKNASATKTMVVQHDHNSERFTFEIPRYIDGHDMSTCNVVQVHYINIESAKSNNQQPKRYSGVYEVDDLQISPDGDDVVICSWLISGNATQYVGSLVFVVRFACTSADGTIDYAWNTAKNSSVFVTEGIYNGDEVAYEYADILAQWKQELIDAGVDALTLDKTLLVEGEAADAKAAGDAIRKVASDVDSMVEELEDIRKGFDGTVYETAGEAVRSQAVKITVEPIEDEPQTFAVTRSVPAVVNADGVTVTNYVTNGNFESADGWTTASGNTLNVADNKAVVTAPVGYNVAQVSHSISKDLVRQVTGDVWFVKMHTVPDSTEPLPSSPYPTGKVAMNTQGGFLTVAEVRGCITECDIYGTITLLADSVSNLTLQARVDYSSGNMVERTCAFSKAVAINLTEAYGAGNEPTADEFYALLSTLDGAYFDGTVTLDGSSGGGGDTGGDGGNEDDSGSGDDSGGGNIDIVSDSGYKLIIESAKGAETLYLYQGAPGRDGKDAKDGKDGKDGVSPTITVEEIEGGNRLTITDKNGTQSVDLLNGVTNEVPTDTKVTMTVADGYLLDIRAIYRLENHGGVTHVDWGDGSATDVVGKTDDEMKHSYTKGGTYTVTLVGLTHLPVSVFRSKNVSSAEIGYTVEFMGYMAFNENPNLTEVRIYADVPPELSLSSGGKGAFDATVAKIIVPVNSLYTYTKAPNWGSYVNVLTADEFVSNVFADKVVTVGADGDFTTINDALNYLSMFYPLYKANGIKCEISILDGTIINEQIWVERIDLSYITITSAAANNTVQVDVTGWTGITHDTRGNKPFFSGEHGARLPCIACLFSCIVPSGGWITSGGSDVVNCSVGYFCNRGSMGVVAGSVDTNGVRANVGFENFYDNIIANNNSEIVLREAIARNAGRYGVMSRHISRVSARSADMTNCGNAVSGAECAAAYADRSSMMDVRKADLSGSYNGMQVYNTSNMTAVETEANRIANLVADSREGSVLNCDVLVVNTAKDVFKVLKGGTIVATGAVLNNVKGTKYSQDINTLTANGVIYA